MQDAANFSVKNLTALFALAALIFYVLGLGRRVAVLIAEGIPTSRAIPLASLQDYLVQGLAVIIDPSNLAGLFSFVIGGAAAVGSVLIVRRLNRGEKQRDDSVPSPEAGTATEAAGEEPKTAHGEVQKSSRGVLRRVVATVVLAVLVALVVLTVGALVCVVLFLPPAAWVPTGVTLVLLIGVAALGLAFKEWTPVSVAAIVGLVGFAFLLGEVVRVALAPPPLDTANVVPTAGKAQPGELLATANGAVYLVQRKGREPTITMYPFGQVRSMTISETPAHRYHSIASATGLVDKDAKWPPDEQSCDPYPGILGDICDVINN